MIKVESPRCRSKRVLGLRNKIDDKRQNRLFAIRRREENSNLSHEYIGICKVEGRASHRFPKNAIVGPKISVMQNGDYQGVLCKALMWLASNVLFPQQVVVGIRIGVCNMAPSGPLRPISALDSGVMQLYGLHNRSSFAEYPNCKP